MPFYTLATIPLLQQLPSGIEQVWYADDARVCRKLSVLHRWWDSLCKLGPSFGYFVNATKTCSSLRAICSRKPFLFQ